MKIKNAELIRVCGFATKHAVNGWMKTLDYKTAYYDPNVDPAYENDGKIRLFIFWHEYISFFIYQRRNCRLSMLLSRHGDADVLERLAHSTGFGTVRGSTQRGGAAALLEMVRRGKEHSQLTMTPDGPRGPRRRMAPGAVYLASKLGIPIVAMGVGFDRPYRLPTWDRFALPRFGSRARVIMSGDINVPPQLSRAGIEHYCGRIETLMNGLTGEAERWAEKGYTVSGQSDMMPGPRHGLLYFALPKKIETL